MVVDSNIVFMHVGTNATVPTGYTRDTDFDGLYALAPDSPAISDTTIKDSTIKDCTLKAIADYSQANGGATGGSATHNHLVEDHTHTPSSHFHTITPVALGGLGEGSGAGTSRYSAIAHVHAAVNSESTTTTLNDGSITLNVVNNDPEHVSIIFVKSNGTNDVADDLVGLWDGGAFPTNWNECDGSGTTPDLQEMFLKGASTGADSNLTPTGDLAAHTHTVTAAHTHIEDAHVHTNVTIAAISTAAFTGGTASDLALTTHTHTASIQSTTATLQTTSPTFGTADGTPPWKKLVALQNNTGGDDLPVGIIALWTGNYLDIPEKWEAVSSMNNYFLKIASGVGEIGDTGGSSNPEHYHAGVAHTHTGNSHQGTGTCGGATTSGGLDTPPNTGAAQAAHIHSLTIGSTTITYGNTTVDTNTGGSDYPEYIKAIFIKYTG